MHTHAHTLSHTHARDARICVCDMHQVQGAQQLCELEQRQRMAVEEKVAALEGLVGQLQSRLAAEHARSRQTTEQLLQVCACVSVRGKQGGCVCVCGGICACV